MIMIIRVSTNNGVTAICMYLFDRGYLYLPKSARAYLFPESVETHYFRSGPISADPISPQPRNT